MQARLYRSRTDSVIGGVCGGLGQYLGIDPVLVRLFFVLLALGSGVGVLVYIIMWIVVPYPGQGETASAETIREGAEEIAERARTIGTQMRAGNPQAGLIVGGALVILGFFFLLDNLNLPWMRWFDFDVLWPLLLIVGGVALLWRRVKGA
ncbi:MAG: PspC domain-containing protein [Anaerolineae bacterium]|nr:PspC domain-containing protein [Anaerolineae bacterium]